MWLVWKGLVEDGRKKVKCVGNGNVKDLKRKNVKENLNVLDNWVLIPKTLNIRVYTIKHAILSKMWFYFNDEKD